MIFKSRDTALSWGTYHKSLGATQRVLLNSDAAASSDSNAFNNTEPTSSIITLGASDAYNDDKKMIAYCWAEIEGYSKFGSWNGNGDADGPFVYCGFKPAWIMVKRTSSSGDWGMYDSSRNSNNPYDRYLVANGSGAEGTATFGDLLSNGFKWRYTGAMNQSGETYIFAPFAESPFQTANAK